jgi:8-oxo-dGTP pyrophosphatase MutT (NUDIX family)
MAYQVYFNNRKLILTGKGRQIPANGKTLVFSGQPALAQAVEDFAASGDERLYVVHSDVDALWAAFCSCFTVLEAAGGAITSPEGRLLLIRRLGKWDLPKGKAEAGETPEQTAVREVMEECGLADAPVVSGKLADTYHTYYLKGKHILKHTSWFDMRLASAVALRPQTSEDITQAVWGDAEQVAAALRDTYGSVGDVIQQWQARRVSACVSSKS